jgi:anti-sigma factor RsiW
MNHDEVRSRFSELLDGALPEQEAGEAWRHIDECRRCREAWDEFKGAFETFRSVAKTEAPPYLVERIKRRIHRRSRGRFFASESVPLLFRVPYEIFSLIIILMALLLFLLMSQLLVISPESISKDADVEEVEQTQPHEGTTK